MGVPKIALILTYESSLPFEGDGVFNQLQPTADEEPGESKKTPVEFHDAEHFPKDSILLVPNSQHVLRFVTT